MKLSGSNRLEVGAPADHCQAVLLDFDAYAEWFPGVRVSRSVPDRPPDDPAGELLFSAGIDLLGEVPCTLRYDRTVADRLTPVVLAGTLRISGPGWELQPLSELRTLVSYAVELEMPVPGGFLAERAFKGPAERYLIQQPAVKLRDRVEAGPASC